MRVCKGVCAMEKCGGGIIGACKQGVQQAGCHPAPPPGTPAVSALESQARAWGGGASAPAPQGRPPLDLWGSDRWVRAHESEHGGATVVAPAMAPALPQTAVRGGGHAVAQAPAHLAAHTMARVAAHCVAHVAAHAVARVAARLMAHALPPLPPRRGCPQTGVTPAGVPVPAPPAAPLQGWRRPACRAAAWMAVAARPSVHRALPVTHFSAPLRRGHRAAAPTPAPLSPPRPCTVSPTPGGCPRVSGAAGGHGEGAASVRSECAQ